MKRDWDLIRELLMEVEAVEPGSRDLRYGGEDCDAREMRRAAHAFLLKDAGFLNGIEAGGGIAPRMLLGPQLTWEGHELLDTLRSKALWERIKATAKEKGLELTFDAVKALGAAALASLTK